MKPKIKPTYSICASTRNRSLLACSILLATARLSLAAPAQFEGPELVEPDTDYFWEDEMNWSPSVPGPLDDVTIISRSEVSFFGPTVTDSTTIKSLTMEPGTSIQGYAVNFVVTGTSDISDVINYSGKFTLGTLSNFDPGTYTLGACQLAVSPAFGDFETITEFNGADIRTNYAALTIFGPNAKFRDQVTGENALLNLATNHGNLTFAYGNSFQSIGNFTNGPTGLINLNFGYQPGDPATVFNIAGNFINDGEVKLYANTVFAVSGGLSGSGSIKVLGLPCSLNVLGTYQLQGGEFNFGGTGIDSFTLITTALVVNSGAKVTGNGTSQGSMTVVSGTVAPGNSAGQIQVNGDLTLEAGSTLEMEIGGTVHDKITQSGGTTGTTLGGVLTLATITNFADQVQYDSTYEILASDVPIAGAFSNIANGDRLTTLGGSGSFQVNYGPTSDSPNKVILSNYIANIIPQSYAQWAGGLDENEKGGADDPNGDGISNLEAYYRGIPAIGTHTTQPIGVTTEDDMLTVTIRSPKTVTGVTVSSILTDNFIITQGGPAPVWVSDTPTYNNYEINIPAVSPKRFVTLKFELADVEYASDH